MEYDKKLQTVQADLAINGNYSICLSQHQNNSLNGQKGPNVSESTKLTDLSKKERQKSFGGVTLRNIRLATTINPNSKLCKFSSILINLAPKRCFFDPTLVWDFLLIESSSNVCGI